MTQLCCNNISLGYDGREIAYGLDFCVEAGDYLCIVGENGSGKTTLMKAILGLHAPIKGNIALKDGLLASDIGYLPQQTPIQKDFPASVWEIVLSGCVSKHGIRPFYTKEEKELAKSAMQKMGVEGLGKRCYRELSGGQQQRVLLARALCATKKILILDEPVSGLDPNAAHSMYELIRELNEKDGITIIMISHDPCVAAKYASHVLHMGNHVFFGKREDYLVSDLYRAHHLHTEGGHC